MRFNKKSKKNLPDAFKDLPSILPIITKSEYNMLSSSFSELPFVDTFTELEVKRGEYHLIVQVKDNSASMVVPYCYDFKFLRGTDIIDDAKDIGSSDELIRSLREQQSPYASK